MIPMNGELLSIIDCTVKKAVEEAVVELKRNNLIVEGKQTPFQKTETLLFNYNNFRAAIRYKEEQIAELKTQLSATDYKVIKCAECQLLGEEMPYDVAALHTERQAIRDEINRLEQEV